jgi:hypothetical protein
MKNTKVDAAQVWKEFEDLLAPGLSLSVHDRAVYSHLFRHSRLEGKPDFQFSLDRLAVGTSMSRSGAREALRRLEARGVLRLIRHSYQSRHVIRLNLPSEVRGVRAAKNASAQSAFKAHYRADIENVDFLRYQNLRRSIHQREGGKCFYWFVHAFPFPSHSFPNLTAFTSATFAESGFAGALSCAHTPAPMAIHRHAVSHKHTDTTPRKRIVTHLFAQVFFVTFLCEEGPGCPACRPSGQKVVTRICN